MRPGNERTYTTQEWIPIKEKEPPTDKLLLFCGIKGGIFLGRYQGVLPWATGKYPTAVVFGRGYQKQRIVAAWLPVPEPYVDQDKLAEYEKIFSAYLFSKAVSGRRKK